MRSHWALWPAEVQGQSVRLLEHLGLDMAPDEWTVQLGFLKRWATVILARHELSTIIQAGWAECESRRSRRNDSIFGF